MHSEYPKNSIIQGFRLEKYQYSSTHFWLCVKLCSGVNRDILVTSPKLLKKERKKIKHNIKLSNPISPLAQLLMGKVKTNEHTH